MKREKITDRQFFIPVTIDRQLITKENAKHMFMFLGRQIVKCIKRNKLIIPKDNFVAYVHVKFICEKDYEEQLKYVNSE